MRLNEQDLKAQKESILSAAFEVFAAVGYSACKMEMISQKAGISRSPLYYHFKSKLELFTVVCKKYFSFYLDKMDKLYEDEPEQSIYERYYKLFLESRLPLYSNGNQLSSQILQGGDELSELKRLHSEYWEALRRKDMAALERAQGRGEIRPDAELSVILNYYYTVYHGLRALKLQEEFSDYSKLEALCYAAVRMMESLYAPEGWKQDRFRTENQRVNHA